MIPSISESTGGARRCHSRVESERENEGECERERTAADTHDECESAHDNQMDYDDIWRHEDRAIPNIY